MDKPQTFKEFLGDEIWVGRIALGNWYLSEYLRLCADNSLEPDFDWETHTPAAYYEIGDCKRKAIDCLGRFTVNQKIKEAMRCIE